VVLADKIPGQVPGGLDGNDGDQYQKKDQVWQHVQIDQQLEADAREDHDGKEIALTVGCQDDEQAKRNDKSQQRDAFQKREILNKDFYKYI